MENSRRRWVPAVLAVAAVVSVAVLVLRACPDESATSPPDVVAPVNRPAAVTPVRAPRHRTEGTPVPAAQAPPQRSSGDQAPISVQLGPTTQVEVRVLDGDGTAVAGASVNVDPRCSGGPVKGVTSSDGTFRADVPAGSIVWIGAAQRDKDAFAVVRTDTEPQSAPVTLRFPAYGRIVGTVRDPDGRPVPNVSLCFWRDVAGLAFPVADDTMRVTIQQNPPPATDAGGRFVLNVPVGRAISLGADRGFDPAFDAAPAVQVVVPTAGEEVRADIALLRPASLTVHVAAPDGSPLPVATVGAGTSPTSTVRTDSGVARFPRMRPGSCPVWATAPGYPATSRDLELPPGSNLEVTLVMDAPGAVAGIVLDALGRPVANATVELAYEAAIKSGQVAIAGNTDTTGRFRFEAVAPGRCRVTASAAFHVASSREVTAPSEDVRFALLRLSTLSAHLLVSPEVPHDAKPSVAAERGAETFFTRTKRVADGFEAELVTGAAGDTRLVFRIAGVFATRSVNLVPGSDVDLGDVVLQIGKPVAVRVLDATGAAVVGATVVPAGVRTSIAPGPDGTLGGMCAAPGTPVSGTIHAEGYASSRFDFVVGDTPATLTLTRGGLLWGEVVARRKRTALSIRDAKGVNAVVARDAIFSDFNGTFALRLVAGHYTVSVIQGPPVEVDLPEGGDSHVTLTAR